MKSCQPSRGLCPGWHSCVAPGLALVHVAQAFSAQTWAPVDPPPRRLVVSDSLGLNGVKRLCSILGCSGILGLGDPQGQLFVIQVPKLLVPVSSLLNLSVLGLVSIEVDQWVETEGASAGPAPSYLTDKTLVSYYGTSVWHGYLV